MVKDCSWQQVEHFYYYNDNSINQKILAVKFWGSGSNSDKFNKVSKYNTRDPNFQVYRIVNKLPYNNQVVGSVKIHPLYAEQFL